MKAPRNYKNPAEAKKQKPTPLLPTPPTKIVKPSVKTVAPVPKTGPKKKRYVV